MPSNLLVSIADPGVRSAFQRLAGGTVLAGPVPGTLVPPQLWDGSDEFFPKGGGGEGRVFASSAVTNGSFRYLELWYADSAATLDKDITVSFTSAEPVDWTRALSELATLAKNVAAPVYVVAKYEYTQPVPEATALAAAATIDATALAATATPGTTAGVRRVGCWDVINTSGTSSRTSGRLYRQVWEEAGKPALFVDHWLLQPGYTPPYLDVKLALKSRSDTTLGAFWGASPKPVENWRYAQLVYTRDAKAPDVATLVP